MYIEFILTTCGKSTMTMKCSGGSTTAATAATTALFLAYRLVESYNISDEPSSSRTSTRGHTAAFLLANNNHDIRTRLSHNMQAHGVSSPLTRHQFSFDTRNSRLEATAQCDEGASAKGVLQEGSATPPTTSFEGAGDGMDFHYVRMNPEELERTYDRDSHAVFGALCGTGLIERYKIYRHKKITPSVASNTVEKKTESRFEIGNEVAAEKSVHSKPSVLTEELAVVDLKLGRRLNGHLGIVHGGIISLVFDEAMGWACECLRLNLVEKNAANEEQHPQKTIVTANLNINFRAPLFEDSKAVVRVFHKCTEGRKISLSARLESHDGKTIYAEAESLFIIVRQNAIKKAGRGVK